MEPWLTREWHLCRFNSGYEFVYLDDDRVAVSVPFDCGDDGHTTDFELAKRIMKLHNSNLPTRN